MRSEYYPTQAQAEARVQEYRDAGAQSYWLEHNASRYEVRSWG